MQRLSESHVTPKMDAVISLAFAFAIVLIIGGFISFMESKQTLLFYISGICSGYAIRIGVEKFRKAG